MEVYRIRQEGYIDRELECAPNFIRSIRYAEPMHCHDYYELFLIASGRCLHRVNGGVQVLAEGALVFIRPDDTHAYDCCAGGEGPGEDCSFINIPCAPAAVEDAFRYLGGPAFAARFTGPAMPPVTRLSRSEAEKLAGTYERLRFLATVDKAQARLLLRSMLAEVFARCFPRPREGEEGIPPWLEALLIQMQKRDNFAPGLGRLEALAQRSPGYLSRVFRRYLGQTPTAYINALRLDFAKSLLLSTRMSILEISLEAGFENLSHFYHLFRGRFGASPGDFRRARSAV